MNFIDDVVAVLQEDEVLAELMTGGIYSGSLVREISRQNAPAAFDANQEILPCMLAVMYTDVAVAPHPRGLMTTFGCYFYQRAAYDTIEKAMARTYDLLHQAKIGEGTWQVLFNMSTENANDIALDCSLSSQRWFAYRLKQPYSEAS
jgi:hypothetical protein